MTNPIIHTQPANDRLADIFSALTIALTGAIALLTVAATL